MLVGTLPPANLVKALPQVILYASTVSLVAQMVKNPPTMLETWVFDPWVGKIPWEGMATICSILAWRIPWTEEPGGLQSVGSQRIGHN